MHRERFIMAYGIEFGDVVHMRFGVWQASRVVLDHLRRASVDAGRKALLRGVAE